MRGGGCAKFGADLSQEPPSSSSSSGHFHILKCAPSHSISPELSCVQGKARNVTTGALMPCEPLSGSFSRSLQKLKFSQLLVFFFFTFFFSWSSIKVRRCPFTPRTHKNTSADEGCNRLNKRIKVLNVRNKVKDGTVWPTYGAGNTLLYHFYLNTHLDAAPRLSTLTPGYNLQSVFFFFK